VTELQLGAFFFGGVEMDDAGAGPPAPMDRRYDNETCWRATLDYVESAKQAERLGYDSFWTTEHHFQYEGYEVVPNGIQLSTWIAAHTERIRLGSAIFQMPARTPAMTAMTAATLDNISGGRMTLGIGSSGPQVAEGWHGQPFARQLQRTREYVAIVRKALARERLEFDGEVYTLPLPGGRGKALKLTIGPVQERIPIYIAAIGPRNTQLAGEIADGWLPTLFSPEHAGEFRALLAQGAARAGDGKAIDAGFDIAPNVNVSIDDDPDRARAAMRPLLALYVGGMGSKDKNFYNALVRRYGFEAAAEDVQDLYLAGRKEEAAAALPAELIDQTSLCGSKQQVAERLAAYRDAGVGTLICSPMAFDPRERRRMIRELAELV